MSNTQTMSTPANIGISVPMTPYPLASSQLPSPSIPTLNAVNPQVTTPTVNTITTTINGGSTMPPDLERQQESGFFTRASTRALTFTQKTMGIDPVPRRVPTIPIVDNFEYGYPRATAFIASDEDFQVYRRYTYLHTRLLLHKQLEIGLLENKLKDLDSNKDAKNIRYLQCHAREIHDHTHTDPAAQKISKRIELMEKLEPLLNSYDDLLFKTQQLLDMKAPSRTATNSIFSYLKTRSTIVEDEFQYIDHKHDLVSLAPGKEKAWVDDFVAGVLRVVARIPFLERIFCSSEDRNKTNDPYLHYTTRWRVNLFVAFLITVLIVALLVAPVYGLFKITSKEDLTVTGKVNASVGVLIGATFIMALMLSMFTRARRHESLAASAAYCAVLVVFIGNIKGPDAK